MKKYIPPDKRKGINAQKRLEEYRKKVGRKRHSEYTCDLISQRWHERMVR